MLASSSNKAPGSPLARPRLVLLLLALAGCSQYEADLPGTWRPSGANEDNLRTMLVNPGDIYAGSGATTSRGDSGARAVTRLLTDRRRPLLDVSLSRVGSVGASPTDTTLPTGAAAQ